MILVHENMILEFQIILFQNHPNIMLKNDVPITKNDTLNVVIFGCKIIPLRIPKDPPNSTNWTRQRWAKVEGIDPALGYKCDKVWKTWESSRVGFLYVVCE